MLRRWRLSLRKWQGHSRFLLVVFAGFLIFHVAACGKKDTMELEPTPTTPKPAAFVNGVLIPTSAVREAVAHLAKNPEERANAKIKAQALQYLINDELALQEALRLKLHAKHERVREVLLKAMIDKIATEMPYQDPSRKELEKFYLEHRELFTKHNAMKVRALRFVAPTLADVPATRARLKHAHVALVGGATFEALQDTSDPWDDPFPNRFLRQPELRDWVGPSAADKLYQLQVGDVSKPIQRGLTWYIFKVDARQAYGAGDLDDILDAVKTIHRGRTQLNTVERFADELRKHANIVKK